MDPTSIVEDTERTLFYPQTDRWTDRVKPVYPPSMSWTNDDQDLWYHMASLGHNELSLVTNIPVMCYGYWAQQDLNKSYINLSVNIDHQSSTLLFFICGQKSPDSWIPGIILCMRLANERQCYTVTSSLIGWRIHIMIPGILHTDASWEVVMINDFSWEFNFMQNWQFVAPFFIPNEIITWFWVILPRLYYQFLCLPPNPKRCYNLSTHWSLGGGAVTWFKGKNSKWNSSY